MGPRMMSGPQIIGFAQIGDFERRVFNPPVLCEFLEFNKFLEIMKNSDEIIISIRKAFEVKELFLGFLSNMRNNKKLIILTPEDYKISDSDSRILRESNVIIRKKSLILLDLLVSNKGDIMIGVPDSSKRPEHTIAIWIKNKEFSESLMKSLS